MTYWAGRCHKEVGPQSKTFQEKLFGCTLYKIPEVTEIKGFQKCQQLFHCSDTHHLIWLQQALFTCQCHHL